MSILQHDEEKFPSQSVIVNEISLEYKPTLETETSFLHTLLEHIAPDLYCFMKNHQPLYKTYRLIVIASATPAVCPRIRHIYCIILCVPNLDSQSILQHWKRLTFPSQSVIVNEISLGYKPTLETETSVPSHVGSSPQSPAVAVIS